MSVETIEAILLAGDRGRTSLEAPERGVSLTARELTDGVERLALQLAGAGMRRGARIVLVLPDGPEFVQVLLAVMMVGAAAAPLNPAYTTAECAYYIDDLGPAFIVAPDGDAAAVRGASGDVDVLDLQAGPLGPTLMRAGAPLRSAGSFDPTEPDDMALLLHTSGTTSRPKQVPLTHRNLIASARAIASHYRLGPDDVSFAAMPLFHVHGLVASVLAQLLAGGRVVVPHRLSAPHFWQSLSTRGVTWFSGSPTVLTMLLDRRPDGSRSPSLRFARSCSAPLSGQLAGRLESALEVPVVQAYGMTEASHQIASNPLPPAPRHANSVGVATGTQIVTIDSEGRELPRGEIGEVLISGPGVMGGYLNNPDANAVGFLAGRLRTGDLGAIDNDGYLRLVGRIKELINRGGEKISPYEIEHVLCDHPAVADAACFAVPDAKYGEAVAAVVVLTAHTDTEALRAFCRERLASFKVPTQIRTVKALPKTATGKIQRSKLSEWLVDSSP